jgi:hypothetical protein
MFLETEQEEGYPATVKLEEEGSALVVHINLKAQWGKVTSPDLCSFYDEFGKNVKQALVRGQTKHPTLSSQKLPEGKKEPPVPSESPTPPLLQSPLPAETLKISPPSLPRGKVIWVYVNIREGPGTQYKIIGKAFMKNTFEILAENPGWLRVRLENGTVGWMSKKASSEPTLEPSPHTPPAPSFDSSKTKFSSKPPCPM